MGHAADLIRQSTNHILSSREKQIREDLSTSYRFLALLGLDDLTYTHLSARHPNDPNLFFIGEFGLLFEEIRADNLLTLNLDGAVQTGGYNKTGFRIHGEIYRAHPEIQAIIHLHTIPGLAVSAFEPGLLPLSQFALHFYERVGYYPYHGLALDQTEGEQVAQILSHPVNHEKPVAVFLRNHGTVTVGTTLQQAFFYAYYLEQACRAQVAILSQNQNSQDYLKNLVYPDPETCRMARDQMRNFEPDLGARDWAALSRKLARLF